MAGHLDRDPSRGGRKRNPALDSAIAAATRAIVEQEGIAGLTIEAVARRAGVARATVYRRWPNRDALLQHLLGEVADSFSVPDRGNVRDDLIELLRDQLDFIERETGRLYPSLSASSAGEVLRQLVGRRKEIMSTVLRRGIDRHQLRSDLDLDVTFFLLWGGVYYRYLAAIGQKTRVDPNFVPDLVDNVLQGISRQS